MRFMRFVRGGHLEETSWVPLTGERDGSAAWGDGVCWLAMAGALERGYVEDSVRLCPCIHF